MQIPEFIMTYSNWLDVFLIHFEILFMIATGFAFAYLVGGVFPNALSVILSPCGISWDIKLRILLICRTSRVSQRLFIEYSIVKTRGGVLSRKEWSNLLSEFVVFLGREGVHEDAIISVGNSMDIASAKFADAVERYFNYLKQPRADAFYSLANTKNFWISNIRIEEAYVMPAVLLTGLLARYQDNWSTFISRYVASASSRLNVRGRKVLLHELYNVFAWLLWGPSKEICWQDGWDGLCQISYGDESNSLSSFLLGDSDVIRRMHSILQSHSKKGEFGALLSVQIDLEPKKLFFKANRGRLMAANSYFIDKIAADLETPFVARIVDFQEITDYRAQNYYCTGYIWILFELESNDNNKFNPENCVAFFEHTNFANANTCKFLTEALLDKTLTHFEMLYNDDKNKNRNYRLVCCSSNQLEKKIKERIIIEGSKNSEFARWVSQHVACDSSHDLNYIFDGIDKFFGEDDTMISYEDVVFEDSLAMANLAVFYAGMYTKAFPDDDERESLVNLIGYLNKSRKVADWTYHVLLAKDDNGAILGGAIFNYFAKSNSVVIEFIVIDEIHRSKHLGSQLLSQIVVIGNEDAQKYGRECADYVFCEVESPRIAKNGVGHLHFWNMNWMKRLDFDYVQPALSSNQAPVHGLWFLCRSLTNKNKTSLSSSLVRSVLFDYVNYAMGVDDPMMNKDYVSMDRCLSSINDIELIQIFDKG